MPNAPLKTLIAGLLAIALVGMPVAMVTVIASVDVAHASNGKGGGAGGGAAGGGGGGGGGSNNGKAKGHDKDRGGNDKARGQGTGLMRLLFGKPASVRPQASQAQRASGTGPGNRPAATGRPARTVRVSTEPTEFAPTESIRPPKRGRYASKLRALNAVNASVSAFLNASEDSRVGRIKAYYEARVSYEKDSAERQAEIALYEEAMLYGTDESAFDGRSPSELQDEIDEKTAMLGDANEEEAEALNGEIAALQEQLAVAEARETYSDEELTGLIEDLQDEDAAAAKDVEDALSEAAAPNMPPAPGTPEREYFDLLLDNKDWPENGEAAGAGSGEDGLDDA